MPAGSTVGDAQPLTLLVALVGQQKNFRILRQQVLPADVNLQFSEAAAEGDVLLGCEGLIGEQQKLVLVKGTQDLIPCPVIDRLRQIDTGDFSPQGFG